MRVAAGLAARARALSGGALAIRPRQSLPLLQQERTPVSLRCLARPSPVPSQVTNCLKNGDIIFACEPLNLTLELDRAIRQVGAASIDWLKAHGAEIADSETAEHCGLVVDDASGQPSTVVEAVRMLGVRSIPLEGFFAEFVVGTRFFVGRVQGTTRDDRRKAVSFAMLRSGAPYASSFQPPSPLAAHPWNEEYYCSSLIDYAYRHALGQDLVFTAEPFPLTFEPREFWEKYYAAQNMKIPDGFGSNPTMLMHSPRVSFMELDLNAKEPVEEVHEIF